MKLFKKKIPIIVILVLVIGSGSFYLFKPKEENSQTIRSQASIASADPKIALKTEDNTLITARPYMVKDAKTGVIIIHDLEKDRSETMQFAEDLAKVCECSTIAFDLRGHGQSQGSSEDYQNMYQDALAAQKYLKIQNVEKFYYVGFGFGAHLALQAGVNSKSLGMALVSPSFESRGINSAQLIQAYQGRVLTAASKIDSEPNSMASKLFSLSQVKDRQFAEYERGGSGIQLVYNTDLGEIIKDWLKSGE